MALSLGSSAASKIYLGATEIALAYLGTTQVYSAGGAFSAEAQNYFDRLDTAGDTTYTAYKQPLANYIDSLVALGGAYWDTMLSSASFVGVGFQGITVPLRSGMTVPTPENFIAADLDPLTGLKGDGLTKYINTNVADNINGSTNISTGIYVTEGSELEFDAYFGSSESGTGENKTLLSNNYATSIRVFSDVGDNTPSALDAPTGLISSSRGSSASVDYRADGISGTITRTGETPQGGDMYFFATNNSGPALRHTDIRAAAMHFSTAMSSAELATLEGLQETLITEIAATFNTLVYQSDFANGATEYTPVRVTAVAPDSPDASTNVISLTPTVDTANHYLRLTTSNVNTSDTYLTKFDVFIASGQVFDGIQVLDWIGPIKFAKTLAGSELGQWVSVSFITTYPVYGQPAIYLTNAGSVSFAGNNSDVAYIRNLEILKQS